MISIPMFLYLMLALFDIHLPGVYMDSVNPDYHAAWILRGATHVPAWLRQDNILAGGRDWPLLNSMYGGNLTAYLAIPVFKIFGFGLYQVRLYHAFLGLGLLAAVGWCLHKWSASAAMLTASLSLLSVDPTYVFAWRTQHYLQLFPMIFFVLGIGLIGVCLKKDANLRGDPRHLTLAAGFLLGLSAYSYFIYFFYVVALIFGLRAIVPKEVAHWGFYKFLIIGAVIGWSPFLYGHLSIFLQDGPELYLNQLVQLQANHKIVDLHQGGFFGRIMLVLRRVQYLLGGTAMETVIFQGGSSQEWANIVHGTLWGFGPLFCFILATQKRFRDEFQASTVFWLIPPLLFVVIAHFVFAFAVGRALQLQHYLMLTPLVLMLTGLGLSLIWKKKSFRFVFAVWVCLGAASFATSAYRTENLLQRLRSNGGIGIYSDVINKTAQHLQTLPPSSVFIFPQWGYWMGILTIIGPRFPMYEGPNIEIALNSALKQSVLTPGDSFYFVLGNKFLRDSLPDTVKKIETLAAALNLKHGPTTVLRGTNQIDEIWVVPLQK